MAALAGISAERARDIEVHIGSETVSDLADWPPFLAARALAGYADAPSTVDPEIPTELVPKLNEHATERASYAVYAMTRPTTDRRRSSPARSTSAPS